MNLDLVLGMTCNNISCLACDRNSSLMAHTASGVVVLHDTNINCQVRYLHLRKNFATTVNFSSDGKLVVTGETGFQPAVRVWRAKEGQEIATLYGHGFGIKSVLFSPTMESIISIGLEHDNEVNVWAWPQKHRLATNKIVDIIRAVAFSHCGHYFVTAGYRHLKFWYPKLTTAKLQLTSVTVPEVQPLYGRPGILGSCKNQAFIDVSCGNGCSNNFVYAITKNGALVIVTALDRRLKRHTVIKDSVATCVKAEDQTLFLGFTGGYIYLFHAISLIHLVSLPVPSFLNHSSTTGGGVFTMAFNPSNTLLTTAYKNSGMCVWDLQNISNIKQRYVAVYHSKAITNIDIFTNSEPGETDRQTLVTVSHDFTIHLWGILVSDTICYDRLSILFTEPTTLTTEDSQVDVTDSLNTITAVKVSPDKKYIVTGNKSGNVCVYDKDTYEHTSTILAHNREITCLEFYSASSGSFVLVSGSRDRLIHVMDGNNNFSLVSTLNIHSSSIMAIIIYELNDVAYMVSCATDRSLSISTASVHQGTISQPPLFHLAKCATIVSSATDIAADLITEHLVLGCQDGNVRILDMALLQEQRIFRGSPSEDSQLQKITLDVSSAFLITAASDRTINVLNFYTGDILVSVPGHTKYVTGLVFTAKGGHVISTSIDGCVFIWRLSKGMLSKREEISLCIQAKKRMPDVTSYKDLLFLLTQSVEEEPNIIPGAEKIDADEDVEDDLKIVTDQLESISEKSILGLTTIDLSFGDGRKSVADLSLQSETKPPGEHSAHDLSLISEHLMTGELKSTNHHQLNGALDDPGVCSQEMAIVVDLIDKFCEELEGHCDLGNGSPSLTKASENSFKHVGTGDEDPYGALNILEASVDNLGIIEETYSTSGNTSPSMRRFQMEDHFLREVDGEVSGYGEGPERSGVASLRCGQTDEVSTKGVSLHADIKDVVEESRKRLNSMGYTTSPNRWADESCNPKQPCMTESDQADHFTEKPGLILPGMADQSKLSNKSS